MSLLSQDELPHMIATYGYWAVAGLIALESLGLPVPGEATLIAAAIAGGTFHALSIWGVVGAASAGAIVGGTIGFWIGRELGFRLVVRYGKYIGLTEARLKLGQYLFLRHGGKVVFFGRFVAVLRAFAAFLAGVNGMPWQRFLVFNAAGGIAWAATYGFGAWYLGKEITGLAEPAAIALAIVVVIGALGSFAFLYRHEAQLQARAEAALPGPLRRVHRRKRKQLASDPRRDQSA